MRDMKRRKRAATATKSRADYTLPEPGSLDPDSVSHLRYRLLNAIPDCASYIPAVHALCNERFISSADQPVDINMPYSVHELPPVDNILSPVLAYSSEVEVTTYPMPVAFLPHERFDSVTSLGFTEAKIQFINSVVYSNTECQKITEITAGQSNNLEWFNQRMGSLTASNFGSILRYFSAHRGKPDGLIRRIMSYQHRGLTKVPVTNIPALKWGLKCEPVARKAYEAHLKSSHSNATVLETGLCVNQTQPYLRASPDGLVACSCHGEKWLLEIKCPFSARNMDPVEAIHTGTLKYVTESDGGYSLVSGDSAGYFQQVQGTMAVTGLTRCDFVIWTLRGMLTFSVSFDSTFWHEMAKPKLKQFFEEYIVAEILTERVWRALPLFDTEEACVDVVSDVSDDNLQISSVSEFEADIFLQDDLLEDAFFNSGLTDIAQTSELAHDYGDDSEMQCNFFDANDFEEIEISL